MSILSYSSSSSDSNLDFEFDNPRNLEHELSSADELFENGVILPIQIQKKNIPPGKPPKCTTNDALLPFPPLPPTNPSSVKSTITSLEDQGLQSKSFWGFKRSASVNADIGSHKRSFLFSLPILPRSQSTGSVLYPRRTSSQRQQKPMRIAKPGFSSSNSTTYYGDSFMQKSSSRKNGVVHVSPVLNVSTSCISKGAANLLGFSCFLPKGKAKRSKR